MTKWKEKEMKLPECVQDKARYIHWVEPEHLQYATSTP